MTTAETIRKNRVAAGMTQAALAAALKIAPARVSEWERGVRIPSARSVVAIRKILGGGLTDYIRY
jgi:transcriptional regulator with XRE-family HTH domain